MTTRPRDGMRLHHRPRRGAAAARCARQRGVLRRDRRGRLGLARPHRRARPGRRRPRDRAPLARLRRPAQRRHRRRRRSDWILEIDADERITPAAARRDRGVPCRGARGRRHLRGALPRPVPGRQAGAVGEVPQVPAAPVPARRLPPRRAARGARGAVGVRARPGRSRATSSTCSPRQPARRRSATPGAYARLEAEQLSGPRLGRRPRARHRAAARRQVRLPAGRRRRLARRLARPGQDRARLLGRRARLDAAPAATTRRAPAPRHYAQARVRRGPVRLLAIASGDERRRPRAAGWLRAARAAGADVALVTDSPARGRRRPARARRSRG